MKIFISKSGNLGSALSTELRTLIRNSFDHDTKVFDSDIDNVPGENWFNTLREKILDCDIFIPLLDKDFLDSKYCHIEAGIFIGGNNAKMIPLIIDELDEDEIIPMFKERHFIKFFNKNRENRGEAIKELLNKLHKEKYKNVQNDPNHTLPIFDIPKDEIKDVIIRIDRKNNKIYYEDKNKKKNNRIVLHENIDEYIGRSGKVLKIDKEYIKFLKEYWSFAIEDDLARKICGVLNSIVQAKSARFDDKGRWKGIWYDVAFTQFNIFSQTLSAIPTKKIKLLDTFQKKDFWLRQIMNRASSSIWTTNLPGTNGRKISKSFLDAQKMAIEYNVNITRVFVYDNGNVEEKKKLAKVIIEQLKINVKVFVIDDQQFNESLKNAAFDAEVPDFMIIDEKYIYKTIIDKDQGIKELEFSDDELQFKELDDVRGQIEKKWIEINSKNEVYDILGLG